MLTIAELEIVLKAQGIETTKAQLKGLKKEIDNTGKSAKLAKNDFGNFSKQLGEANVKALAHRVGTVALAGALVNLSKSTFDAAMKIENLTGKAKDNAKLIQQFSKDWEKAQAVVGGFARDALAATIKGFDDLAIRMVARNNLLKENIKLTQESLKAEMDKLKAEQKARKDAEDAAIKAFKLKQEQDKFESEIQKKRIQYYLDEANALSDLTKKQEENYNKLKAQSQDRIVSLQNEKIANSDLSDEVKKRAVIDQEYTARLKEIREEESKGLITKRQANDLIKEANKERQREIDLIKQKNAVTKEDWLSTGYGRAQANAQNRKDNPNFLSAKEKLAQSGGTQ